MGYSDPKEFWKEVKTYAKQQNMDETLAYMNLMIDKAKEKNIALTAIILNNSCKINQGKFCLNTPFPV